MTLSLTLVQGAYIVAGLLFILALAGLSKHETARAGNRFGVVGMGIALVITILAAVGGIDAARWGRRCGSARLGLDRSGADRRSDGDRCGHRHLGARSVEMTGMPELIALLHSFVGLAAVLVGGTRPTRSRPIRRSMTSRSSWVSSSARVTLTGSIVAFLKLSARIKSAPLVLPGRHLLNLGIIVAFVLMTIAYVLQTAFSGGCAADAARRDDRARALPRAAPGRVDRRWRHAGRRVDAQLLLGVGGSRGRLPAQQRPAHHHRCVGRLLGCLPVLHHVQGDEPVIHLRHRRWLRSGGRLVGGWRRRLRRAP